MADEIDKEVESIANFPSGEPDNYGRDASKEKKKKEEKEKAEPLEVSESELEPFEKKKETRGKEYEEGERNVGLYAIQPSYTDTPEGIKKRKEYEKKMVESGAWSGGDVVDATFKKAEYGLKNVPLNPVDILTGAKGYASESKLKWEASKYGITPEEFESAKTGAIVMVRGKDGKMIPIKRSLSDIKQIIDLNKSREIERKRQEANIELVKAQESAIKAQAAQRYAKAEQIEAALPSGGRKLIGFGHEEGSFGQGKPLYLNSQGSHGQLRQKFIPGKASGVSTSLAASKLEIARMKQRVLSGPSEGGVNAVQLLQPKPNIAGLPSTVSRLAASSPRANPVSKLSPTSTYRPGPSILDKLSSFRKRP